MSGYLEVKYPFKSNLALNPFKSWKRQWCILRPCPRRAGSGALAVYSSEAGAAAGSVDLPAGCVVRRAHSRTRPYAFAVYGPNDPRKPRLLLAAHTSHETQLWMDKIRSLLSGNYHLGSNIILKDSFSVNVMGTEYSRKLGLMDAKASLQVTSKGLTIDQPSRVGNVVITWPQILNVTLKGDSLSDKHRICVIMINSDEESACPELSLGGAAAVEAAGALRRALADARDAPRTRTLSRSHSELSDPDTELLTGPRRRRSWNDGPSEVSLDDTDLVMSKESGSFPWGQLSRCSGGELAGAAARAPARAPARALRECHSADSLNDSMCSRRSLVSLSSGVYEEIADDCAPASAPAAIAVSLTHVSREEPMYESVAESVFATLRPHKKPGAPPPLPPRHPYCTLKPSDSWRGTCAESGRAQEVTRHSSLGSLPRCCSVSAPAATGCSTLPKLDKTKPFNMFRKRLKSDSRVPPICCKGDHFKAPVDNKKKRFEFAPSRDMFKNFRMSRGLMKNLKISSTNLAKIGETKSCEFLDESEHAVVTGRCAKSVECLDAAAASAPPDPPPPPPPEPRAPNDAFDEVSLPDDIVELILRGRDAVAQLRLRQRRLPEDEYVPVSPAPRPPSDHYAVMSPRADHHYVVMSPRTDLAAP